MFTRSSGTKVLHLDLSTTGTINSGNSEDVLIQPSKGQIYRVIDMYLFAPAIGGSANNHHIYIKRDKTTDINLMLGTNVGTSNIVFNYGSWSTVATSSPSAIRDCQLMFQNLIASNTEPITITYDNQTDTNQTNDRKYLVTVEVLEEVI